jgi:hypothetical protein
MMNRWTIVCGMMLAVVMGLAWTAMAAEDPAKVTHMSVRGEIEGEYVSFILSFHVETTRSDVELPLFTGQLVMQEVLAPTSDYKLRYDEKQKTYYMSWPRKGKHEVSVRFAAKPTRVEKNTWQEVQFDIPSAQVRQLEVTCDRTDLEVQFPKAMRLERELRDGKLVITAILGPAQPFGMRWKPQVQAMDAKLVMSSQANTIARISAGAMNVDAMYLFDVAQGKLSSLSFRLPRSLSITQVRGDNIRDWSIDRKGEDRILTVTLNRPQTQRYGLQILSEMVLGAFPVTVDIPVIQPLGGLRAGGYLAVGTDSAIQLLVEKTGGLSQIDTAAFPRASLDSKQPRALPRGKSFFYTFAATPYQMTLKLADIVPSYDAAQRLTVNVKEDDLTIDAEVEVDIRDAPMRSLNLAVPGQFVVAAVSGASVEDYRVIAPQGPDHPQRIEVMFKQPVLGRTVVGLRLELGRGPLDEVAKLGPIDVVGAKGQRGYVVVAAEGGVQIESPTVTELREVHTGSVPMRVPNAQYAYRFREANWSMELLARKKPAGVRVESFHLESLGEGIVYSSVAVNYFITGSPVDELHFHIPEGLSNVEFVGRDVRRATQDGERWTVKLQRKVIGDYNLGIIYNHRYTDGASIMIGAAQCEQVETQTGYIVVASHLNLQLQQADEEAKGLLEIGRDEVPANYRLLANAPILKTYKYVKAPHRMPLTVNTYQRGQLLSAVVDIMEASTKLAVRDDREAESVTTIRYKIKNTSSQFLELTMPPGAVVWSTRLIERDPEGQELATPVVASFDKQRGVLMIPLKRRLNPNDPSTVEVEYGQVHGTLDWWRGNLVTAAPRSEVPATYANWSLTVPQQWSIRPAAGNMIPDARAERVSDASAVLTHVAKAWERGLRTVARSNGGVTLAGILGLVSVGTLIIVGIVHRRWLADAAVIVVLVGWTLLGLVASQTSPIQEQLSQPANLTTLSFTQAVNLDPSIPLSVGVDVVPSWRQDLNMWGGVVIPAVVLVALLGALISRRWRVVCVSLVLAGAFYTASQFAIGATVLGHVLTWGVPVALGVWFCGRNLMKLLAGRPMNPAVTAALVLMGFMVGVGGCATGADGGAISDQPVIEKLEAKLHADNDAMDITMSLRISVPKTAMLAVLSDQAVLLSPAEIDKDLEMKRADGAHFLHVKRRGTYNVELQFLMPLAKQGDNPTRSFTLAMPVSLINRVQFTVPEAGLDVHAPDAVRLDVTEANKSTVAVATFAPGDPVRFGWRPRVRQTSLEDTQFFSEVISVARFDAGMVEARHSLLFQIAQGELKDIRIRIPDNMTVTAVEGANLGAWRFDPATHELEAKLSAAVAGQYRLSLVTQVANQTIPYSVTLSPLVVLDAQRQRGMTGILSSTSVHLALGKHPQSMNVDDFARNAAALLKASGNAKASDVRYAFRTHTVDDAVSLSAAEVTPELRADEQGGFKVADDRLLYQGSYTLNIAKAGLFSTELKLPAAYDIDGLASPEISHWDEVTAEGIRTVTIHFNRKVLGQVRMNLELSRPVSELPDRITVPRVEVLGALKHTGQVIISSDRGVRLSVLGRQGVSELNPLELGVRQQGTLAFKLLGPQWKLDLATEVVEPRITVGYVHVAKVTDGLVRHTHYLRYRLHHAGSKVFMLAVPSEALGLLITGADIARREEVEPGKWRIELASKVYEQPYSLQVSYETRFDQDNGEIALQTVRATDADLERGHVVVFATDRVELATIRVDPALVADEARSISRDLGAGDLSGAAFCYRSSTGQFELALRATRHNAAALLAADVQSAHITTVVTETGESVNRVDMRLRVGSKRHLQTILPHGAQVWSLEVNGRAAVPSRAKINGDDVLLVPLSQAASGELMVELSLVYVLSRQAAWTGRQMFEGPRFDLPLKDIAWTFYVPEAFKYDGFEGTLTANEEYAAQNMIQRYDLAKYESDLSRFNAYENVKAQSLQKQAKELAQAGRQYEARQALELGKNYSRNDVALNEDIRVDLQNLLQQQAKVGLVGSRVRLRQQLDQPTPQAPATQANAPDEVGDQFSLDQANRIESSLSKFDSENLEMITRRMIEMQEAAAGANVQLMVSMPLRGRVLQFERPLQVKPASEMSVSFDVARELAPVERSGVWSAAFGLVVLVVLTLISLAAGRWDRLRSALTPQPVEPKNDPDDLWMDETEPTDA